MSSFVKTSKDIIALFETILSPDSIISLEQDKAPFLHEWRDRFFGDCACILFPKTTQEVVKIISFAHEHSIEIVPQGGNTGLVGGQIPDKTGRQVILSAQKLNKIRNISKEDSALVAESGVILENIHHAASEHNLLFPLSLASEGSAQIGGLISTNAGGTTVLRYGNMRNLVLGLEVVLPNGDLFQNTHYLRKANKGFDVNSLFMGAEGIHGFITAASLRLFAKPVYDVTMMVALDTPQKAIEFLVYMRDKVGDLLTECELIPKIALEAVINHKQIANPFDFLPAWCCLVTVSSSFAEEFIHPLVEKSLEGAFTQEIISDAVVAQNQTQAKNLRYIRMLLSECQKYEGASLKHDVSVPVSKIPALIDRAIQQASILIPSIRPMPFGHVGDGNLHFDFLQPVGMERAEFLNYEEQLNKIIFDIVHDLGGCFSAEHGIGILRRSQLHDYSSDAENNLRIRVKQMLDAKNIMNPHKTIPLS